MIQGAVVEELQGQVANVGEPCSRSILARCCYVESVGVFQLLPRFLAKLEEGDLSIEMDLSTACLAKEEKWHPRDNACTLPPLLHTCGRMMFTTSCKYSLFCLAGLRHCGDSQRPFLQQEGFWGLRV